MGITRVLIHTNTSKSSVSYFVLKSQFILSVEVIPNLNSSILGDDKEHSLSSRRPAAITQVGVVELCPHDWGLKFLMPDLCCPVTNCQEVFKKTGIGISLHLINWSKMSSTLCTESVHDFDWFLLSGLDCQD